MLVQLFDAPQRTFAHVLHIIKTKNQLVSYPKKTQLNPIPTYRCLFHFLKTFVQRQIVPHTVLPSGGRRLEIRIMRNNPSVNLFDGQRFFNGIIDGKEDQRTKAKRWFVGGMDEWIVGQVGGVFGFLG